MHNKKPVTIDVRPSKTAVFSMRIPLALLDQIEEVADAQGVTLSRFVLSVLEQHFAPQIEMSVGYPNAGLTVDLHRTRWNSNPSEQQS